MDQLHCFVGNQWKKHFDTPTEQVVCRLTGSIFVVGSVDTTGPQLAARMQELYEQMPHECITTTGMMHRVQFTMSGAPPGWTRWRPRTGPPSTSCAMPACARCRLPAATGSLCRITIMYRKAPFGAHWLPKGAFCMENQKNDNLNLLEAVVQNTEMGKNTLEQIVPMTDDTQFKAELLRQRNLYHQLNQEAHTAMEACGGTAQGQSAMAKFNTKMGISMKTLTDKSTRNLAEMLTQGSGMGVVDCVKAQKDYPNAAPGTKRLAQRLMEFEEDNRVRLEQFL